MSFSGDLVDQFFLKYSENNISDCDHLVQSLFSEHHTECYIKCSFDKHSDILEGLVAMIDDLHMKNHQKQERIEELLNTIRVDNATNTRRRQTDSQREKSIYDRLIAHQNTDADDVEESERRAQYTKVVDAFSQADADKDGLLNFEEFSDAWDQMGIRGNSTQRKRAFLRVDKDRSGHVSFREFLQGVLGDDDADQLGIKEEIEMLFQLLDDMEKMMQVKDQALKELLLANKHNEQTIQSQNKTIEDLKRKLQELSEALRNTKIQLETAKKQLAALLMENKDKTQSEL